jgi:predicted O-linked N-acetylglucosamine transferase (SPINDLY family)
LEGIPLLARAAAERPNDPFALYNLGAAHAAAGQWPQALEWLERALKIDPAHPPALSLYARLLAAAGHESQAVEQYQRLTVVAPSAPNWRLLAAVQLLIGDLPAALYAQRRALEVGPPDADQIATHLFTLLQDPAQTHESLIEIHRHYFPDPPPRSFPNNRNPDRPLKIGVLSSEWEGGTAAYFLAPILQLEGLQKYDAKKLRNKSDADLAAQIRADEIDVMLDISGLLPGNRFPVIATRVAPVQIQYPRYPAATGLAAIDYRITDPWADPNPVAEENLLRLPSGYLAYTPPPASPASPTRTGPLKFGFFPGPVRLNEEVLTAIANILQGVPDAALLVHYLIPDFDRPGTQARRRIEDQFKSKGIEPNRLEFAGPRPFQEHLELVASVDIALDSFPYNGQTNTCECLWMGVPVLTKSGDRFATRVSAAILHRVGLEDWIATSTDDYITRAITKATDPRVLRTLRQNLRPRLTSSSLTNPSQVTKELESALRQAWRHWCATSIKQA